MTRVADLPEQLELDFTEPILTDDQRAELAAHVLPGWARMAACAGEGNNTWYPDNNRELLAALTTCAECPVRRSCLASALSEDNDGDHGIWGGTTELERYAIRQRITVGVPIPAVLAPAPAADPGRAAA